MILTDTFIVERAEIINESRGGKVVPVLKGVFGRCDEKNNNGRVYSKPLLEREVTRIAEAMTERRLLGELDHPSHDSVKLSNVSHLITNLAFNGNELVGECELLDTPSGKVAKALVEGGVKVGISSRGMGTLSEQADGSKHVNEDFKLVTFDLVADPSTRGAYPGVSESNQSHLVEEIVTDTLDKAAREKVFTTLLKDKLREKSAGFATQEPGPMAKGTPEIIKKNKKKPTAEDPFRNWEDLYGAYTGKPRIVKTRGYDDAETVTEPQEVVDHNIYCQLKDVLLESGGTPVLNLTYGRIAESLIELDEAFRNRGSERTQKRHLRMRKKGGEVGQQGSQMLKQAGRDLDATKSMPAGTGGFRGAIAALKHNRAYGKAMKLQARGMKTRERGKALTQTGIRQVDKAAVRARVDAKLAAIRKNKGLQQQAQIKQEPRGDQRPQLHHPKGSIPGPTPGKTAARRSSDTPAAKATPKPGPYIEKDPIRKNMGAVSDYGRAEDPRYVAPKTGSDQPNAAGERKGPRAVVRSGAKKASSNGKPFGAGIGADPRSKFGAGVAAKPKRPSRFGAGL